MLVEGPSIAVVELLRRAKQLRRVNYQLEMSPSSLDRRDVVLVNLFVVGPNRVVGSLVRLLRNSFTSQFSCPVNGLS